MNTVFLASPQGDEIKEVEATAEKLTPLLVTGWRQVAAPVKDETAPLANAKVGK